MKLGKKIMSLALVAVMAMSLAAPAFADTWTNGKGLGATDIADAYDLNTETYGTGYENYNEINEGSEDGSSVVVLKAAATTFKVTVPIALHVNMAANGDMTYADEMKDGSTGKAKVINQCSLGAVKITDVQVVAADGWELVNNSEDFANMKVNSKKFAFTINGQEANASNDGAVISNNATTDTVTSTKTTANASAEDINLAYADYESITYSGSNAFPVIKNGSMLPIVYTAKLPAQSSAMEDVKAGAVVFTVDFYDGETAI